jgi:hypothetical protein
MSNVVGAFSHLHRYVLRKNREGSPFHWLQSLEKPPLAFVLLCHLLFDPHNTSSPWARLKPNHFPRGAPERMALT